MKSRSNYEKKVQSINTRKIEEIEMKKVYIANHEPPEHKSVSSTSDKIFLQADNLRRLQIIIIPYKKDRKNK